MKQSFQHARHEHKTKRKLPTYAGEGIRDYWIADLEREVILVHRQPKGKGYREVTTLQGDDVLSLLAAPDFSFIVREAFD